MRDDYFFRQIKKGDREAFEHLFTRYYRGLVICALHYVRSVDVAEDIVQDVFFKLWKDRKKIVLHTSMRSYLSVAVKNKSLDHIKHYVIRNKAENDILRNESNPEGSGLNVTFDLIERIEKTINTMPEQVRNVFIMSRYESKKYKEIAEILGISVKTVEASVGKALRILREALRDWI